MRTNLVYATVSSLTTVTHAFEKHGIAGGIAVGGLLWPLLLKYTYCPCHTQVIKREDVLEQTWVNL
jgi:hypothetical protein